MGQINENLLPPEELFNNIAKEALGDKRILSDSDKFNGTNATAVEKIQACNETITEAAEGQNVTTSNCSNGTVSSYIEYK